jgi:predicted aspartyl protease
MPSTPFSLASPEMPIIVVQVEVNGAGPFEFLMDTGNGTPLSLLVSPALVERLGFRELSGEGGDFPLVHVSRFQLGGHVRTDLTAGVLPELENIAARLGLEVVGNIGHQFFKDWRIRVDYPGEVLWFTEGGKEEGESFATGELGSFILVPARVNGRGPYRFLLDTGASVSVISPQLATELGIQGDPAEAVGVVGSLAAQAITLDSIQAAGQEVRDTSAAVIDLFEMTSRAAGMPVDGILGYPFLRQFQVEIDYLSRRLALNQPD